MSHNTFYFQGYLSFPRLGEAEKYNGKGKPRYTTKLLFPMTEVNRTALRAMGQHALQLGQKVSEHCLFKAEDWSWAPDWAQEEGRWAVLGASATVKEAAMDAPFAGLFIRTKKGIVPYKGGEELQGGTFATAGVNLYRNKEGTFTSLKTVVLEPSIPAVTFGGGYVPPSEDELGALPAPMTDVSGFLPGAAVKVEAEAEADADAEAGFLGAAFLGAGFLGEDPEKEVDNGGLPF